MRRLILLVMLLTVLSCTAQTRHGLFFYRDGDGQLAVNRRMELVDVQGKVAFELYGKASEDGNTFKGVFVQLCGFGQCNGQNVLVLVFRRGQRLILNSTTPTNCQGKAFFPVDQKGQRYLRNYELWSVRFLNGINRNYADKQKDGFVRPRDRAYFIQFFYAVDNYKFSNTN